MIRPYRESDADELWERKREFELGLGAGDDEKGRAYEAKLDESYRESYLAWVARCVEENERTVQVADPGDGDGLAGYVFVLPESLAYIWDAAVLNELYVRERHRGAGVADELMEAALETASEQSLPLDRVVLDVDRTNDRARAFYERWGFESWGEMVARGL